MKEACGYAKERIEKMDKCPKYQNNRYFDACLKKEEKRKEEKIAHFSYICFQVQERENFKEHSKIRISHHQYPPHCVHLHILI
jgi:hypothetical protein